MTNVPTNPIKAEKPSLLRRCYGADNVNPALMDIPTIVNVLMKLVLTSMEPIPNIWFFPPGHFGAWNLCARTTLIKTYSLPVSYTHLRAHETRHDLVCR